MNSTPTTGELKVKMDAMSDSIEEIKRDIREGFSSLKKDLQENYVRKETFATYRALLSAIGMTCLGLVAKLLGDTLSK